MINPYASYILGFVASLLLYQLGWSKIFPELSSNLIIFLFGTFAIHAAVGLLWRKKITLGINPQDRITPKYITFFLYLLWVTEFFYGGVPILEIIFQTDFDYRQFGIPMLHVVVVTFSSFYAVFLFHLYVTLGKKEYLLLFVANLVPSVLIYNRGMMLFILTSAVFIFVHHRKISIKLILVGVIATVGFLFFFGVMGNFRQVAHIKRGYSSDLFVEIIQPTDRFKNSGLAKEFLWGYTYISSPLANLETNIRDGHGSTSNKIPEFFVNEMIPDFVAKRINRLFDFKDVKDHRIPGPFNVATVYSRSFSYLGWWGLFLMAGFIMILPWIYWWITPENEYKLTGMAILSSMYLLLVFDNTIRFTGFSFQLAYPFFYPLVERTLTKVISSK